MVDHACPGHSLNGGMKSTTRRLNTGKVERNLPTIDEISVRLHSAQNKYK